MYSSTAIQALIDRIGWDDVKQPTSKVLTADNLQADSGNIFSRFHALAIPEVVEEVMPISNADTASISIDNDALNAELYRLKGQAARKCLGMVFDSNPYANYLNNGSARIDTSATDWSDTVISKVQVLDELYGLCMASLVLDMCINNSRKNARQRSSFDTAQVKMEQDGITDANGVLVAKGITHKIAAVLKSVNSILFPQASKRTVILNASCMW